MEDKTMSASAANDSGFVQSNGNDGEVESARLDGGGHATVRMANPSIVSYPAASWLEFTEWLERGLDDYGLEPTLYARCVLSILKQPPELATDISIEQDEDWTPTPAASFLSVVSHHVFGKNNSAPSSRKNSFGSLATAAAAASATSATVKSDADTRKQALLDCLTTMNGDEAGLGKFVDDIVHRYSLVSKAGVLGEKQNESVDSGVCPSPEESFQNYDEAFPPLATDRSFDGSTTDVFIGETVGIRPRVASSSWLTGKRPAEARVKSSAISHCGLPISVIDDGKMADDHDISGRMHGDGSPVKRPKLLSDLMENEIGGRTLHSCPDFDNSSGTTTTVCAGKRATFCCPVVKKQSSVPHSSASVKIPPHFIIPKCWKVGSWPSRYDRSTKPAADVPFWSCSEWFCTVHKRLEFGLLNAKINGDTKSLAVTSAPATTNASCCGYDRTTSAVNVEDGRDVEIFEIEPPLSVPPTVQQQQTWNGGQTSSQKQQENEQPQQQAQVVPEMFDAPRFILHIINEDDTSGKDDFFPPPKQNNSYNSIGQAIKETSPASDWNKFFDLSSVIDDVLYMGSQKSSDVQYGNSNNSPWAAPLAQSEFSLDPMDEDGNVDTVSSAGILLPVDVSHLANGGVGFCLPKCVQSVTQQQQRQQQFLLPPTTTAAGVFNKLLENQDAGGSITTETVNPKQQPQSVAVPIRESTHFRPIRSESMEDAYYLKPGFDEFSAAIENIEEYYVYQQKDEPGAPVISATTAQSNAPQAGCAKNNGGQQRHSLELKFRASKPDKMCQTDEFNPDLAEEGAGDVTNLMERYRQEFEIWAFQPSEMRPCMHMPRWDLNESSECNDAMVVGPLSPHIDDGWLDELVGTDSPPVAGPPKMIRDEQPILRGTRSELGVGGTIFQQQQQPVEQQGPKVDGQQQLEIWQQEDERYEDSLLRYVSNISLISPLDIQTTTV